MVDDGRNGSARTDRTKSKTGSTNVSRLESDGRQLQASERVDMAIGRHQVVLTLQVVSKWESDDDGYFANFTYRAKWAPMAP